MSLLMPNIGASSFGVSAARQVHVAVGAIVSDGLVLLAKRAAHQHQGNLWEFPGGKVEVGESVEFALKRELYEELGITPKTMQPLIQIHHSYPDKSVLLDVLKVTSFDGDPVGREGQPLEWVPIGSLSDYAFPAANRSIVTALQLPQLIAITPAASVATIRSYCMAALAAGAGGIQLRSPNLSQAQAWHLYDELAELQQHQSFHLWLNSRHLMSEQQFDASLVAGRGVHLTSVHLSKLQQPLDGLAVTAACHCAQDLARAAALNIQAAYVSPVLPTASHEGQASLGWVNFSALVKTAVMPVYALGGMTFGSLECALSAYAQGVAGIRLFDSVLSNE
jgi:8-oxo-dGTP diphosphatase